MQQILKKYRDTPLEEVSHDIVIEIVKNTSEFLSFYDDQFRSIASFNIARGTSKEINDFYLCFNKHVSSEEYVSCVQNLQKVYQSGQQNFHRVMTEVMIIILSQVLRNHQPADMEPTLPEFKSVDPGIQLSGPGRGKVRYVGGYVIAKLKYRNSRKLSSMLFAPGKEKETVYFMKRKTLLVRLTALEKDLIETSADTESLVETSRKQNIRGLLCNITDETYNFFCKLEVEVKKHFSVQTLQEHKSEMYIHVENLLLNRLDL